MVGPINVDDAESKKFLYYITDDERELYTAITHCTIRPEFHIFFQPIDPNRSIFHTLPGLYIRCERA